MIEEIGVQAVQELSLFANSLEFREPRLAHPEVQNGETIDKVVNYSEHTHDRSRSGCGWAQLQNGFCERLPFLLSPSELVAP